MRVFSVASRAAFPELPLASTQNLTIAAASFESPEYTERGKNRTVLKCFWLEEVLLSTPFQSSRADRKTACEQDANEFSRRWTRMNAD
jgi:hypothetical protein